MKQGAADVLNSLLRVLREVDVDVEFRCDAVQVAEQDGWLRFLEGKTTIHVQDRRPCPTCRAVRDWAESFLEKLNAAVDGGGCPAEIVDAIIEAEAEFPK